REFLIRFGLNSIDDLPSMEEFSAMLEPLANDSEPAGPASAEPVADAARDRPPERRESAAAEAPGDFDDDASAGTMEGDRWRGRSKTRSREQGSGSRRFWRTRVSPRAGRRSDGWPRGASPSTGPWSRGRARASTRHAITSRSTDGGSSRLLGASITCSTSPTP